MACRGVSPLRNTLCVLGKSEEELPHPVFWGWCSPLQESPTGLASHGQFQTQSVPPKCALKLPIVTKGWSQPETQWSAILGAIYWMTQVSTV